MLYAERLYAAPFVDLRPGDVILSGGPCSTPIRSVHHLLRPPRGRDRRAQSRAHHPARMFELIREHGVTVFAGVPHSTPRCSRRRAGRTGRPVQPSASACPPPSRCPPTSSAAGADRFGVEILDGIGTTEATARLHQQPPARPAGSSGRAVPGYEDPPARRRGRGRAPGEIGNLPISGGSMFAGVLEPTRRDPASAARRLVPHRRQVSSATPMATTGTGPHRRHAARQRPLGLPCRSGGGADHPSRRARGGVVGKPTRTS